MQTQYPHAGVQQCHAPIILIVNVSENYSAIRNEHTNKEKREHDARSFRGIAQKIEVAFDDSRYSDRDFLRGR